MHFQSLCSSYYDSQFRLQSRLATLDIIKFLCSQVSSETSLCNDIIAECHSQFGSQHRVTTVSNVSKRTTMNESSCMFCCLYQVRRNRILQQYSNGTSHTQIFYSKRLIVDSKAQQNIFDSTAQIIFICSQTQNCHNLGSWSDIKSRFTGNTIGFSSQSGHNITKATVVYIKYTIPQNFFQGKAIILILIHIVIQQSRNHIMGRSNGMEVTGKVQVDFLHRKNLSISTSGCSTFHTETRTQRRLTQCTNCFFANLIKT